MHVIAPSLTCIFNLSLSTGIFVDAWKDARVNPIYKEGSRRNIGNYRPISILPIVSKVFLRKKFFDSCTNILTKIHFYRNFNLVSTLVTPLYQL